MVLLLALFTQTPYSGHRVRGYAMKKYTACDQLLQRDLKLYNMKNSPCCLDTLYGSHISVLKDLRPALEKVLQTAKNVVYYKKEAYK